MPKKTLFFPDQVPLMQDALGKLAGQRVAVLGHLRPDGDCIGSQVAMARLLESQGIEAACLNGDPVPRTLLSFPEKIRFHIPKDFEPDGFTALTVDCADAKRVGSAIQEKFPRVLLNVDHHISNSLYGETNIVVPTASATAEILAGLAFDLNLPVDAVTAQALFVGIATDTGQFRFNSTTAKTFEICHRLCECGANPAEAALELYEKEKFGRLVLLQRFLASLQTHHDNRVCLGVIREEDFSETGTESEDAEGFVDYARSVEGVDIGAYIEARSDAIKGSFRAKDPRFRVDLLAKSFDGGGHACAAGFRVTEPLATFEGTLLRSLEEHLAKVDCQD